MKFRKIMDLCAKTLLIIIIYATYPCLYSFSSATFWKSTCNKFVRGSHFENLSFTEYLRVRTSNAIDIFGLTSMWAGQRPTLLDDGFDQNSLSTNLSADIHQAVKNDLSLQIMLSLAAIAAKPIFIDCKKIANALNFEEHIAGAMMHLGITFEPNIRVGVGAPILAKITHLGDKNNDIEGLWTSCLKTINAITNLIPSDLPININKDDLQQLLSLINPQQSGLQIGDLRFYAEKNFYNDESIFGGTVGIEAFLASCRANTFIPAALSGQRPLLSSTKLINDIITLCNKQDSTAALTTVCNDGLQFIDNFFATLNQTFLSTDHDLMRSGIGLYINPSIWAKQGKIELFAKIRANYLFATNKITVFPLKNYDSIETVAFVAKHSPLSILQLDFGAALHTEKIHFYGGYDFYLQSKDLVSEISNAYDSKHEDLTPYLVTSSAERPHIAYQNRIFATIGYKNSFNHCNFLMSLSASWSFRSSISISDKLGFAFTFGVGL